MPVRASLKKRVEEIVSETDQEEIKKGSRQSAFTQDDLTRSWMAFERRSKDAYFKSMFQYCRPVLNGNWLIEIDVISPEQERKFKEELRTIKGYLADELQNDQITFQINLKESDTSELVFTDKEKYSYLLQKNSDLGLLVKEFNLRLD